MTLQQHNYVVCLCLTREMAARNLQNHRNALHKLLYFVGWSGVRDPQLAIISNTNTFKQLDLQVHIHKGLHQLTIVESTTCMAVP